MQIQCQDVDQNDINIHLWITVLVIVVESSIDFVGLYFVQGMWVVFIVGQITQ